MFRHVLRTLSQICVNSGSEFHITEAFQLVEPCLPTASSGLKIITQVRWRIQPSGVQCARAARVPPYHIYICLPDVLQIRLLVLISLKPSTVLNVVFCFWCQRLRGPDARCWATFTFVISVLTPIPVCLWTVCILILVLHLYATLIHFMKFLSEWKVLLLNLKLQ